MLAVLIVLIMLVVLAVLIILIVLVVLAVLAVVHVFTSLFAFSENSLSLIAKNYSHQKKIIKIVKRRRNLCY